MNAVSLIKENIIEIVIYSLLFAGISYSIYSSLQQKSFDTACELSCNGARSATPIIDFRNQCLCDLGHGKWQVVDVRTN